MALIEREPWYITREAVQRALDVASTRRTSARIDECIASASRDVDGLTHRVFYPWTGTRYFDFPGRSGTSFRVWLDASELAEASAVVSGDGAITDYFLEPVNSGPPFNRIEVRRYGSFVSGDTEQRAVAVTGTYAGCALRSAPAGTLAALMNSSTTTLALSDGSLAGVGSILLVGTERMQVTEKAASSATTTVSGSVAANAGVTLIPVASGPAVHAGEVVLIGSERMLVTDVNGNNLVVKRAWDGTVLATHVLADGVLPFRSCTVTRGDLGTTAAAHSQSDPITSHAPPGLVQELTMAYTLTALTQGSAAYALTTGSGDSERESSGRGVRRIEMDCSRAYRRAGRIRSV